MTLLLVALVFLYGLVLGLLLRPRPSAGGYQPIQRGAQGPPPPGGTIALWPSHGWQPSRHPVPECECTQPSATYDWRGACSISNRCLFAGCFYPLGDMCVFCFKLRPVAPLGRSPLEELRS